MQQPIDIGALETRVKIELEVVGELQLPDIGQEQGGTASGATGKLLTDSGSSVGRSGDTASVRRLEMKSKAVQDYLELIAFDQRQPKAAARQYLKASSENWVAGKSTPQTLRPEASMMHLVRHEGVWSTYCPAQPIDRREVDLLRSPINSLALEKLLSLEPARSDSKWSISKDDARDLFNLEAVQLSSLVVQVSKVEKGTATIEIKGNLEGTARSVPTELQVRGSAHVIMGSQCAMISWLGISIKETRQISQYQPGFTVTARLQLARQELNGKIAVTPEGLLAAVNSSDRGRWLARIDSKAGYSMLADRNWVTYIDSGEDAILRLIKDNRVTAQCNIAQLPKLDAGSQLTLEGLQQEIQTSLGKGFHEFLEASERVTPAQLRLLRVEVAGVQDEVAIRWIYAHLSDDSGRRLALVYTLAAEQAERFAGCDLQMLDSLQFNAVVSPPSTTTPAKTESNTLNTSKAKTKVDLR